jgi:hypothetical protein
MNSHDSLRWRNRAALALTVLGCSAMLGDMVGSLPLKGLGAASAFAPFPKVFCDNQGLEGFASEFTILARHADGSTNRIELTPELYSGLKGPYNRRNVYGAALSFGPKLPAEMWRNVFEYGLGPGGPLRREFDLPGDTTYVVVVVRTKTSGRSDQWTLSSP